jgi:arylesterase/paraoxonase
MRIKVVLILLLLIGGHFGLLVLDAGILYQPVNHNLEHCIVNETLVGPEDFAVAETGALYISSDDRSVKGVETPGALWLFENGDLSSSGLSTSDLSHPHGLGIWGKGDQTQLFVINHSPQGSSVEIFRSNLSKMSSIMHPLLINPNDIHPMGQTSFYVTHDHGSTNPILKKIENYSRFGRGYVSFYDGMDFRVVSSGISYANGVVADEAGRHLFVASMLGKKIYVFSIESDFGLKKLRTIDLEFAPDNLSLTPDGDLIVGAHTKALDLAAHAEDPTRPSAFAVLRIMNPTSVEPKVDIILSGDGVLISGVSGAQVVGQKLFVGSIFQKKMLVCDLDQLLPLK